MEHYIPISSQEFIDCDLERAREDPSVVSAAPFLPSFVCSARSLSLSLQVRLITFLGHFLLFVLFYSVAAAAAAAAATAAAAAALFSLFSQRRSARRQPVVWADQRAAVDQRG
jgi:hypothetical protein